MKSQYVHKTSEGLLKFPTQIEEEPSEHKFCTAVTGCIPYTVLFILIAQRKFQIFIHRSFYAYFLFTINITAEYKRINFSKKINFVPSLPAQTKTEKIIGIVF